MSLRRQQGFTLVELLIVAVIIGIIAAIAIPELLRIRQTGNAASAVEATRLFHSTEVTYESNGGEYGTVTDLFKAGLIDGVLAAAGGVKPGTVSNNGLHVVPAGTAGKAGYLYTVEVAGNDSPRGFSAIATPVGIGRTGDRSFYVDESGIIKITCTPPKKLNPVTGRCEPEDSEITDGIAIESLLSLDRLANGIALSALVSSPPSSSMVAAVLGMLDGDGDGLLAADEVVNADVFAMARQLKGSLPPAPDVKLRDSKMARAIVEKFRQDVVRELAIGLGNEVVEPVPLPTTGDAMRLIGLASRYRAPGGGPIRGGQ